MLAATADELVATNGLQHSVTVVQKLSSQLVLAADKAEDDACSAAASSTAGEEGAVTATTHKRQQLQQQLPDLPGKAALVVHEIFGSDPLSEHVLPALQQVQQQLAAPGAVFVPGHVRIIAAVATCPVLLRRVCIGSTLQHQGVVFDVSSLLPLQPRKVEMQLDELQDQLMLLTQPQVWVCCLYMQYAPLVGTVGVVCWVHAPQGKA